MDENFISQKFDKVFNVQKIITIFYMELSKNFHYDGEKHDFWEMVYIDKGEMICTADKKKFSLKGGELTFHSPNEFHNLSSNQESAPNVFIVTFECKSAAMKYFGGKIFKLDAQEKRILSMLFEEGSAAYELADKKNPLLQKLKKVENAPFGSSQMTKNMLEIFLIKLCRNKDVFEKYQRFYHTIDGAAMPYNVKEIVDFLQENVYERISVEDIAGAVGKSVSTIKNIFALYKPHGIIRYFNGLKIEEAKKLIREGKYNFTQISELLKFDTPQYFSGTFRRYTNMSPMEYKNSILP